MFRVPVNIKAVELTKYRPSAAERTRLKRINGGEFLSAIRVAINKSQCGPIGSIPEPFDTPRYLVRFLTSDREPVFLKVFRDFIVTASNTYALEDTSLWTLLESKVSDEKEAIDLPEKPCFHRQY